MARKISDYDPLEPTILDRLINPNAASRGWTLRDLKESVRRDLEALLKTRWYSRTVPKDEELDESLLNYGVPDFSGEDLSSFEDRRRLCQELRAAILRFEPRLKNVNVSTIDNKEGVARTLRVRVEAVLSVASLRQEITFDSQLDPSTTSFRLAGESE